jgi:type I restriction enzyme S subunit
MGSVADINPPPVQLASSEPVSFVPMAAVDDVAGVIQRPEPRLAGEVNKGYKQFRKGDVIFARITPSMQNGKSAIADIPTDWGYGSTEFHVIRTTKAVLPAWIHSVVRSPGFRTAAERRFTGTAGQQRVPAAFISSVEIPVPPLHEQKRLLTELQRLADTGLRLRRMHEEQRTRIDALGPSILNHVFDGGI